MSGPFPSRTHRTTPTKLRKPSPQLSHSGAARRPLRRPVFALFADLAAYCAVAPTARGAWRPPDAGGDQRPAGSAAAVRGGRWVFGSRELGVRSVKQATNRIWRRLYWGKFMCRFEALVNLKDFNCHIGNNHLFWLGLGLDSRS